MKNVLKIVSLLCLALVAIPGAAQEQGPTDILPEIRLNLARVSVNEGSLVGLHPDEISAIWHTQWSVAGGADASPEDVLNAQRRLSPRVTGAMEARDIGNERWSRFLTWSDAQPAGWDESVPWNPNAIPLWARARERAERLVRIHFRGFVLRPCDGQPYGWGGRRVGDEQSLQRRNANRVARGRAPFVILNCGDTSNFYFGLRRST